MTLIKGKARTTIALAVALLIGPASPQVAPPKHGVLGFTKSPQAFEPNGMIDIFLEDLDSDGDGDAVISSMGPSLILMNDGRGLFMESQRLRTDHGLQAGDIDKDGGVDLVAAPQIVEKDVVSLVYPNSGRGVFQKTDRDFGDRSDENVLRLDLLDTNHYGESPREKAIKYIGETICHNLPKVKEMYRATLDIDLPQNMKDIIPAIIIRHDISSSWTARRTENGSNRSS